MERSLGEKCFLKSISSLIMPKEIDESKLNYNKYPGEHVVAFDGIVTIGGNKTFHLVMNFRDAFDAEKLEQRFSDVFDKYDYIVGDWGFEQLRLKGFFSSNRKKMDAESKIDHLEDYINEYCNYGAPYFVLRRVRARDLKNEPFKSERVFEEKSGKQKLDKPRRKRNRNKRNEKQKFEIQNRAEKGNAESKETRKEKKKLKQYPENKTAFVIRERNHNA